MNRNSELSSILDECIYQLHRGASLDEVLAEHPNYARELRPLLETAAGMKVHRNSLTVPADAQSKSRYRFLSEAAAPAKRRGFFHPLHLRLAITALTLVVLVIGLLSTGLVSAFALPGDTLYPVKLTLEQIQLSVASTTSQRLMLQEQFDEVRAQEVNQLKDTNRSVTVTFSGIPAKTNGDWSLAGIKLNLTQQDTQELENLQGYVVQVTGETEGNAVNVAKVQPKVLTFSGIIDSIQPTYWVVAGVKVSVEDKVVSGGEPVVGRRVTITANRQDDGSLIATQVDVEDATSMPQQITGGSGGENTNTPDQEQNQPATGTGDDHGGLSPMPPAPPSTGESSSTPAPTYHSGDRDHQSTPTPQSGYVPEGDHGSRTPEDSERNRETPHPTSTRNATPTPEQDHSENTTPRP